MGTLQETVRKIPKPVLWALGIICVVFVLIILSKSTQSKQKYTPAFINSVKFATKEAARLQVASEQDTNPLMAVTDINYAVAYMKCLRRLLSAKEANNITGMNIDEFIYMLEEQQQKTVSQLMTLCPAVTPNTTNADKTGWVA